MTGYVHFEEVSLREDVQPTNARIDYGDTETVWNRLANQASHCAFCHNGPTCDEADWESYIEVSDIFVEALRLGWLRGVVGIFAHHDYTDDHESISVRLARDLVQRDILVIVSGCTTVAMNQAGLTGLDAADLVGEYIHEKRLDMAWCCSIFL